MSKVIIIEDKKISVKLTAKEVNEMYEHYAGMYVLYPPLANDVECWQYLHIKDFGRRLQLLTLKQKKTITLTMNDILYSQFKLFWNRQRLPYELLYAVLVRKILDVINKAEASPVYNEDYP